ncbi:MAG: hypothetical protein IT381_04875 [Deltaproteobacteria bacterium]|nr:hypothetical protein [Deltaproteobacteria bacterium]
MGPPGRIDGQNAAALRPADDAVVLTATPAFDPVTQTYAVAVLDGRSDLADDALLDQYIADEKAAGNDVMAALEARLPSLAPADRKAALKKLLTFSAEGPDGRALKKPSTDELKTLIASLENPEATPTPAPAESKQSVELPLPKSLDAKKVEKDATLAKAALTADPQTFQKAMQRYQTREQREAVLYVVFKDAAPEELAHAKEIMAKVWDPGLKRQLDIAIRVREAQLPGGALYGVESPDAIAAYRNFVGPTCDTWLKQLGISEDDVKAWLTAPPGTPPPASIQKALDDVQNGRPSYANVNFVLYGMPAFIALQKARGVSAEDLKPQDALINKARNQGLIVQKQEAGALEGEAAYHDRLAADLDKKAEEIEAGANPGDAVKLREQANTQRAMAKTQRGAAIVTTTNIANMYEKQINTPGAKPSQATLDAHTEMTDATGRMILVDAKDETGHLIVLAGQHKGDKAYTDETPPKLTNDEPRGKPGDPDYFPGGVGYWVDKGEEYNSKAGESGGHVSLKTDYQGYKRYVDNKFLELRDYPPKSPPATYDPRAEELRIESVQLLADEKKTVEDRVAYLMAKSPRTAKEDDDLLAMNGRLQTLTSELNAEKKRLKKAIDDGKIAHKQLDAATKAVSGLTDKLDGAVVTEDGRTSRRGGLRQELKDLEERQKGAETDTAKAAFTTAIANKKLEIKQAEIDQNLATQKLELLQRQQKAAGQPALGDMIARTEGSVIKALNAEYGITDDGKGAPEIGPSTDVIYAAATKSTEYVETNLMPPKEGLIGVEDKDKVKFGTVSLENGAFYADKSAAERGSGNQPTPQSLADAKKATECVSYSVDALDYIWAGSELHQQFAPVVAEGSRTVAIDLAKVDPKNASLCLRYADTATGLIDLDAITPTKADGTKKSPEEIAEEKAAKKALKDKLTIDNALNGAMAVVMGAFCSPADPNQRPPDMTMASIRRARELINKIQPPTTEATKALEALDRLESFATGAITLNNNRADLAKRSAGNANASITIAQEEKDAALEKTQSIFVDLPIISTLTLGVGVLVDDEIDQAQLESGGAWTMAQLRDAIKKKQLTDKLSPVEQQLSDNLDALAMMSDVLEKATAEGRQFEVYKYIATGDTEALQGVADELGATDGDGQAFQATKVTELITDDQSAFKSYFLHGDNYFKDAEAQGFDMVDASDEAEEVAHTQGTVTGTQSSAVQRANIESTDYQKDMIWVQIAVAAGEMVLSCFIPGAALRTMASIGRYAKLAIGVARVASFVARARTIAATYRVVRITMSALRFAAAASARWQTFAKSGRAAGLLAKVVEAYAVFGIQKGVTKLAEAAGIPKNTFGGKLFYFAVGAIGTSAQNKIAKWTQAGKEVILPTAQFMATTFGIPLLPKEKQEFWNEVAEYGFPAIGALVGSYNEHGAIKRQHAEGAMQLFNGALAEKGHPPLSEKQQGQGADLLYKVATAKDSVSYENARAELQVWGEKNKLPPEAMKGLDQQAAVAYAGTKHLGADVNWAKESPTPEALTKKYDDVVAELMAAHPEMPIEQARMFAQQLIAGKINAAMPVVAEGQEPNQKDAAKIKELGGALDAVNLKMAHDTAATATERNVKERGVELDDAQKGFVREELVPEMMKTLGSETLTPEQGVAARAKMKERLVNEQKMTPEQADAVVRGLAEECAAQVGRSSTAVACEGQLPETVLRIAEENNLRRLGYSPEEAHAIAVGHYAPDAAMSAMCDANTQIASAGGTLITKEQAKAIEGDIASAIEGYDRDARAGGKSLGDVGKDLEAKLTPVIGAENARAVAKATVANLVADAALGAGNGSGPGLASLPSVDGPEQRKAQVDAIEKLMTEAAKGTEPPLFSAAEIADAKGTAIEKMALEDGAKRTAEDGKADDPKALMDNVEASAAELQKTFPDIDPKQVRADAAVKQASEFILQNAGENTAKMTPEQAEKEIAKVAVEQFGCDPAQVKKAIQKRNAEIKAAETKGQERAKMADDAKAKPPVVRSGPAAPPPPDDTNTEAAPDSDAAITQDAPTVEAPTVKTAPGDDGTVNGAIESLLIEAPHRRLLAITESGRTFAVERDADGKIFLRPWDNKGDVGPLGEAIVELRLLPAPDEPMKSVDVTGQKQPEGLEIARWEPMSQKEKSERAEIEQEFGKKFADDFYPQLKRARQRFDASNEVDLGPFSLRQDVTLLETIAAMPPDLAREALDTYAASTDEGRARLNTIVTHAKDPRVGMAAIRYAYEKAAANGQRAVPLEILDAIVQATAPKTGEPQLTDPAAVKGVVDALFEQHSAREAAPDSAPSSSDLPPTKPGKKGAPPADEATKPQGKKPAPKVETTDVSPTGPATKSKPVSVEVIDTPPPSGTPKEQIVAAGMKVVESKTSETRLEASYVDADGKLVEVNAVARQESFNINLPHQLPIAQKRAFIAAALEHFGFSKARAKEMADSYSLEELGLFKDHVYDKSIRIARAVDDPVAATGSEARAAFADAYEDSAAAARGGDVKAMLKGDPSAGTDNPHNGQCGKETAVWQNNFARRGLYVAANNTKYKNDGHRWLQTPGGKGEDAIIIDPSFGQMLTKPRPELVEGRDLNAVAKLYEPFMGTYGEMQQRVMDAAKMGLLDEVSAKDFAAMTPEQQKKFAADFIEKGWGIKGTKDGRLELGDNVVPFEDARLAKRPDDYEHPAHVDNGSSPPASDSAPTEQPPPKPPDTPAPLMSATPPVMSDEPKKAPTTTQNTADASVKEAPRPPKLDLEGVPPQNKNELELLRQYAGSSDAHLYRMITDGVRDNAGKLPSPAKERVLAAVDAIDGYRQAVEAHGVRRMITGDELAEAQKMPSFAEAHWRPWVDGAVDRMKLPPDEAAALKQNLYDAGEGLRRMPPGERKLALEWLNEATGQMRVEMLELLGSRSRIAGEVDKGTLSQEDAARISEPYNPFKRIWRSPFEALKRWWWGSKIASGDLQTLAKAPKELWKDEAFALSALARFGKYNLKDVFPYIPASLRGDAAFMLEVVRAVGAPAMEFASASLAKNPQFIKEAIKLDPNVIHHGIAAELMKTDREVALAVVSAAGARDAYGTLPDKLRNDPEIALAAVRAGDATTYAKVPPGLRDDPKIIGAAIDRDGSVLLDRPELATDRAWAMRAARAELAPARIPAAFMDDPEVVAAYVRRDPLSLASASPRLGSDRALISLAIDTLAAMPSADRRQVIAGTDERKATAFGRIFAEDLAKHPDLALAYLRAVPEAVLSTTFAKDQRLAEMALMTDRSMFNWMPEGARTDALIEAMALKDPFFLDLPSIKPELRERILAQHPEIAKARADIVAQAKGVGITQLGRFAGIDVLREVIKNRTTPDVNDPRPLAVVVYPKDDHNGAFESANAREDLKALSVTHRLVFIEARNDADAVAGIKAATKNRPTGLLILGAHGAPTAMEWSKGNDAVAGSKTFKKGELDAALAPGATVILESCSTGSGRFDQLNMANFFSWLMPSATVHAPTKPVATELSLDASGRLKPRYTEGEHNTYVIPGTTASDETKRDAGKLIEAKEVLVDGERFLTRVAPDGRGVELVTPTGDVARTLTPDECKALVETGDVVLGREAVNASFEKERANTQMREQRDECRNIVASMSNGKMMSYYTARIGEAKTPEAMAALRAELEPYKSGGLATTPATLHHVHEGERVSSPQSPYDGKWNGKGAHDWPAIAKIAKEPGYKILEVREDPTTGARFVKIERQGFDKKQNKVVTSTFEKTIYPKSLTPEQVDAAGEAAFQSAKRGAKDTVFTTQPGPPPITKFEATVVAGIPPTEIRIGGFAQGAPPGPFEITTHFPTKATDPMTWPVVPESGY